MLELNIDEDQSVVGGVNHCYEQMSEVHDEISSVLESNASTEDETMMVSFQYTNIAILTMPRVFRTVFVTMLAEIMFGFGRHIQIVQSCVGKNRHHHVASDVYKTICRKNDMHYVFSRGHLELSDYLPSDEDHHKHEVCRSRYEHY